MKIRNVPFLLFISATALSARNDTWQIKLAGGDYFTQKTREQKSAMLRLIIAK